MTRPIDDNIHDNIAATENKEIKNDSENQQSEKPEKQTAAAEVSTLQKIRQEICTLFGTKTYTFSHDLEKRILQECERQGITDWLEIAKYIKWHYEQCILKKKTLKSKKRNSKTQKQHANAAGMSTLNAMTAQSADFCITRGKMKKCLSKDAKYIHFQSPLGDAMRGRWTSWSIVRDLTLRRIRKARSKFCKNIKLTQVKMHSL